MPRSKKKPPRRRPPGRPAPEEVQPTVPESDVSRLASLKSLLAKVAANPLAALLSAISALGFTAQILGVSGWIVLALCLWGGIGAFISKWRWQVSKIQSIFGATIIV